MEGGNTGEEDGGVGESISINTLLHPLSNGQKGDMGYGVEEQVMEEGLGWLEIVR